MKEQKTKMAAPCDFGFLAKLTDLRGSDTGHYSLMDFRTGEVTGLTIVPSPPRCVDLVPVNPGGNPKHPKRAKTPLLENANGFIMKVKYSFWSTFKK